jgi:hypothetical protein
MSAVEAVHAAEILLVVVVLAALGALEVFDMLLAKLGQTAGKWKAMRRAWQQDETGADDQASDAEPAAPGDFPPS